jgi:hypothetical protein
VETVQVAACLLEFLDPFLWLQSIQFSARLLNWRNVDRYLRYHHMAIEGPLPMLRSWFVNMTSNLRHNRCSKSDIWDKMSVHYIYVKPVGAGVNHLGAFCAQIREISGENGGCDNGGRRHRGRPAEIDLNERSFAQIPVFWDLGPN